ncbi:MAG TPA: hypothetical protein VEP90_09575, partial [Methylomirabilota bacterium]|nr:hypothetical protein [Methylomirabilota bacterium]
VGARAEELPKFNHQDTELYRRSTEGYQHLDQDFNVRLYFVVAALASPYYATSLAVYNPYGPEQKTRDAEKAYHLRKSINSWHFCTHIRPFR